jgi:glycosyltransferase involved in cell wall biosynthesis
MPMQITIKRFGIWLITFYGHVSDPQSWYKNIDIFVSNSYSEGLQVAPMEAMASGCYCLSHRWEGADELVPEASLYYTNQELQDKLLHYCDLNESEKQKARAHMREIACDRFDLEQTKAQIRKTIAEVM